MRPHAWLAVAVCTVYISAVALVVLPWAGAPTAATASGARPPPAPLPPLLPLTPLTTAALLLSAATVALAAGGGIGAGGVMVPVLLLVLRAPPRAAVALTNVTVCGGAAVAFLFNIGRRHPTLNRPLIDWDVMLLMEPATIVGAVVGTHVNKVAPEYATLVSLVALLTVLSAQLVGRARAAVAADSAAAAATVAAAEELLLAPAPSDPHADPRLAPPGKVATMVALFAAVAAADSVRARVVCGSPAYWTAVAAIVPVAATLTVATRARLLREAAAEAEEGAAGADAAASGSVTWTPRATATFLLLSIAAGLVAGAFGIGGGVVKGPLLLALGVPPLVTAATAAAMILFTTATAVMYAAAAAPAAHLAAFGGTGAVATAVGLAAVARALARGRRSVVVVTMAALMVASTLASGYKAATVVARVAEEGAWRRHGVLCPAARPPSLSSAGG